MNTKNLLIITFGMLLGLTSCKKEDAEILIGKWNYNTITASVDPENQYISGFINTMISAGRPDQLSMTFNEDGTYILLTAVKGGKPVTSSGTYKIGSGVISLTSVPETSITPEITTDVSYSLSKKSLTTILSIAPADIIDILLEHIESEKHKEQLEKFLLTGIKKINFTIDFSKAN